MCFFILDPLRLFCPPFFVKTFQILVESKKKFKYSLFYAFFALFSTKRFIILEVNLMNDEPIFCGGGIIDGQT
jgi:hypothetical protein